MVEIVIGLAPNLILLLRDVAYTVTLTDGTAEGQSRGIHLDYDVIHEVFTCLVSDIAILWLVCGKYEHVSLNHLVLYHSIQVM